MLATGLRVDIPFRGGFENANADSAVIRPARHCERPIRLAAQGYYEVRHIIFDYSGRV